jgi:hypothetical protein
MSTGKANALVHALYNKVVTDVITKSRVRRTFAPARGALARATQH